MDGTSSLRANSGFNQMGGSTVMDGKLIAGGTGVNIRGGTFSGTGIVRGDVETGGVLAPGDPTGTLTIHGNYSQTSGGTLMEEVGWINGANATLLKVNGTAKLSGTLALSLLTGYTPMIGDTFTLITFASETGSFSNVTGTDLGNGEVLALIYSSTDILAEVEHGSVTTPEPGSGLMLLMGFLAAVAALRVVRIGRAV